MRLSPYPSGRLSMKDVVSLRSAAKPHSLSSRPKTPTLSRLRLGKLFSFWLVLRVLGHHPTHAAFGVFYITCITWNDMYMQMKNTLPRG